jgi:hypothetical protein
VPLTLLSSRRSSIRLFIILIRNLYQSSVNLYFNLSIVAATAFAEFAKMMNRWRLSRSCAPRVLDRAVDPRGRSVSQDSQALKEWASAVRSELNELRVARSSRDFWVFICGLVIATPVVVGAIFISHTQSKRLSEIRALAIDPMMPSERIKQLADRRSRCVARRSN